jgi:phenylacetate-CoA ligase
MSGLYDQFLRGVILPLGDWYRQIPIGKTLDFLEESQWWPADRLVEFRHQKLQAIIAQAYEHVPYYREVMDARRLKPGDIRKADDLPKLPLLTRQILRDVPRERFLNQAMPAKHMSMGRTGGTTGEPLVFYISRTSRAYDRATLYRFYRWCGGDRGALLFTVWAQLIVASRKDDLLRRLKRRYLTNEWILDAFAMTPEAMRQFVQAMCRLRPKMLRGYTSALTELARFVVREGLETPPLAAMTTTAEPILPEQREVLERAFRTKLYDQYGCAEVNGVSFECEQRDGLHIASEHVIVEVVDDGGCPLPPGRVGRVVLTHLDNEAMPFIRYATGDMSALRSGECPCGRQLPLMEPVRGRTLDMIIGLNGQYVYGAFFIHLQNELGWTQSLPVHEFQVVQTSADRLEYRLVSGRPPTPEELQVFIQRTQDYLGPMQIDYRQVERVDRTRSGKLRYTIRQWNPEPSTASTG